MAEFKGIPQYFTAPGLSVRPRGMIPPGKQAYHLNLRQYTPTTLEIRAGTRLLMASPFGAVVHSLARLNDITAGVARRIAGSAGNLFAAAPADPQTFGGAVDTGWTGPWTSVALVPRASPRPYQYIADSGRYRKLNASSTVYSVGLPAPTGPPATLVSRPGTTLISKIDNTADWSAAGTAAGAVTSAARVTTVVSAIFYDYLAASFTPATTGYCAIIPGSPLEITEGMLLTIDGELVVVDQILIAVVATTIASIVYDSGTTGPCSIYPTASLGTGQLETPPIDVYRLRYPAAFPYVSGSTGVPKEVRANVEILSREGITQPLTARTGKRIRQVDFPVGCLVTLGGAETIPILSVNVNADGFQSFRCVTTTTRAAGDAILGLGPGFRCHLNHTVVPGATITANYLKNTITPVLVNVGEAAPVTGGIQRGATIDLSAIGSRPTLSEDFLRLQVRVTDLTVVNAVRLYLDCNASPSDFLQNYFVFEWRANDLIQAIQATNAGLTRTFTDVTVESIIKRDYDRAAAKGVRFVITDEYLARVRAMVNDPTFQQLALGNNQWVALEVPVSQLVRVGTDTGRTLSNILAAQVMVVATTADPITVSYQGLYLTGGYGPDIGKVGDPYVYRYRYRSSITGETSNPSPVSRSSVIVRRQAVSLYATAATNGQADLIDWFRFGGSLTRWTYAGSAPNTTAAFLDTVPDGAIDGGEGLPFDDFQPWIVIDQRRSGTCKAAGAAIQRISGDTFDSRWAPGTLVLVNGKAATLDQVISTSVLLLAENAGTGATVDFVLPNPQLVAIPLPTLFTDQDNHVFAVGDTRNPGALYWAKLDNPDAHSDANSVVITAGSDALVQGGQWDNQTFVFSRTRLYEIQRSETGFTARPTACEKGLWCPLAMAVAPMGVFFLSDDGIYLTQGGSIPVSTTAEDIPTLFPHDGVAGTRVGDLLPPDLAQTTWLRLTWVDTRLYFDYLAHDGVTTVHRTLVYDPVEKLWFYDAYAPDASVVRLPEAGTGVHNQLLGLGASVGTYDGQTDQGAAIAWAWQSARIDGGDPRSMKLWGDAVLDCDPKGSTFTVSPAFDGGDIRSPQTVTGADQRLEIIRVENGEGALARRMGLRAAGSSSVGTTLYFWEPSAIVKAQAIDARATDWDDLGVQRAKFVQGIIIRANTYGVDKTLLVQGDGATKLTLTINHTGEIERAYPVASTGWVPWTAHLVRLWPASDLDPWLLLGAQWVFEPAPELATEWTTQPTTHDFPGYLHVRDAFLAYSDATAPMTFEVIYDGVSLSSTITPGSTAYERVFLVLPSRKGRSVSYRWKSTAPFRLFKRDTSVRVHGWGQGGTYQVASPFGGPHRQSGAEV